MESLDLFMDRLASPSPAPGGGAASAAVALIGSSLVSMVAGLTMGKKGYEDQEESMKRILEKSRAMSKELRILMDEDEKAFNTLYAAWKMPRGTEEEKSARKKAIEDGTKLAIKIPWKIAGASRDVLSLAANLARYGNSNAITDAGSALEFSMAAIKGAIMNIEINIKSIQDRNWAENERMKIRIFLEDAVSIYNSGIEDVRRRMSS